MTKTFFLGTCSVLLSLVVKSQELAITGDVGYVVADANLSKRIMLLTGSHAAIEWELDYKRSLKIGAGLNTLSYTAVNDTGASVFARRKMIFIPISLRRKFQISRRTIIDLEFGVRNSLYFLESTKVFNSSGSRTEKNRDLLYNLGGMASFGLSVPLEPRWDFNIGMGSFIDLISVSKNNDREFKANGFIVQIGFIRKL